MQATARRRPRYPVHTLTVSKPPSTSSLVTASSERLLRRTAWRNITQSSQPARRRRPVTVPNSRPTSTRRSPSASSELRRERSGAHAGGVGLGDPDDAVEVARPQSGACAGAAGGRVRRRDVGVGAMVEVEERRLGALEQDVRPGCQGVVQETDGVGDVGRQPGTEGAERVDDLVDVESGIPSPASWRFSAIALARTSRRSARRRVRLRRGYRHAEPCRRTPGRCL